MFLKAALQVMLVFIERMQNFYVTSPSQSHSQRRHCPESEQIFHGELASLNIL